MLNALFATRRDIYLDSVQIIPGAFIQMVAAAMNVALWNILRGTAQSIRKNKVKSRN